jgi:hypothetical protein
LKLFSEILLKSITWWKIRAWEIEPQFEALAGENRCKTTTSNRHRASDREA